MERKSGGVASCLLYGGTKMFTLSCAIPTHSPNIKNRYVVLARLKN